MVAYRPNFFETRDVLTGKKQLKLHDRKMVAHHPNFVDMRALISVITSYVARPMGWISPLVIEICDALTG